MSLSYNRKSSHECLNHTIQIVLTTNNIHFTITNKNTKQIFVNYFTYGELNTSLSLSESYTTICNAFNYEFDYYSEIIETNGVLKLYVFAVTECFYFVLKKQNYCNAFIPESKSQEKEQLLIDSNSHTKYKNLHLRANLSKLTVVDLLDNYEFQLIKHDKITELVLTGTIGSGFTSIAGFDSNLPNLTHLTVHNAPCLTDIAETLYNSNDCNLTNIHLIGCPKVDESQLMRVCNAYQITLIFDP